MTDSPAILGLQRNTLRMQAIEALRRAITTGELPPGSHVSEIEMSTRLGISRGTLREAMRTLELEGLLTSGPAAGCSSGSWTKTNCGTCSACAPHSRRSPRAHSPRARNATQAVAALRAAADRMSAAENESLDARMRADLDFHRELCRLTGNATLVRAWSALEGSILMSITRSGIERAVQNMDVPRHLQIVDAIATGDPDMPPRRWRSTCNSPPRPSCPDHSASHSIGPVRETVRALLRTRATVSLARLWSGTSGCKDGRSTVLSATAGGRSVSDVLVHSFESSRGKVNHGTSGSARGASRAARGAARRRRALRAAGSQSDDRLPRLLPLRRSTRSLQSRARSLWVRSFSRPPTSG